MRKQTVDEGVRATRAIKKEINNRFLQKPWNDSEYDVEKGKWICWTDWKNCPKLESKIGDKEAVHKMNMENILKNSYWRNIWRWRWTKYVCERPYVPFVGIKWK